MCTRTFWLCEFSNKWRVYNRNKRLHTFMYAVGQIRRQVVQRELELDHMTTCESSGSSPQLVNSSPEGTATHTQHQLLLATISHSARLRLKVKQYSYGMSPYEITQCYLPPDTSERTLPNPSQKGWYSINLSRKDGRLSWPGWLVTYWDGVPARRVLTIQVLTGAGVE